jgi:iron-sulfur cluster assembly accessory protein
MSQDSNPNLALRIQVESGGCHGFQYLMSLTTLPPVDSFSPRSIKEESLRALNTSSNDPNVMPSRAPSSSPLPDSAGAKTESTKAGKLDEDDTVFAADDGSGAKVVMDGPSLELLKGSKIDYTMELIGSQFKIVDNPLATSSCGCGTSFDIKA